MNYFMREVNNGNQKAIETFGKIISFMITKREALVCSDEISVETSDNLWKMMEANIVQTGFCFSKELKEKLKNMPSSLMSVSYNLLLEALRTEKGANVSHKNFIFPFFPNDTRVTSLDSLCNLRYVGYLADLMEILTGEEYHHYIGLGEYAKHPNRTPLDIDMDSLIPIRLVSMDDFYKTVSNLLGSRMALNESDKEYVLYFLNNDFLNKNMMIPKEIPFKETWAMLLKVDYENKLELQISFKNFFDFERAYASFMNADVSLSEKIKLKNLDNKKRVFLLSKLEEGCKLYPKFMLDSMIRNKQFVVMINNRLHPKSYGSRFNTVVVFFDKVMSKEKIYSDFAKIEILIAENKGLEAMKVAISNPGDAIRRLAKILSLEDNIERQNKIIAIIKPKVNTVDTSVLLNTLEYFKTRNKNNLRVAMPKGNAKKSLLFLDEKKLNSTICNSVIEMLQTAIEEKLSLKEQLGKVYVDKELKNYNVPFSTRNESKSFRSVARGSRLSRTEDTDVIRAFVYKKIKSGGFVDLSCAFLDKEFHFVEQCSWTNLKTDNSNKPLAMHSGDGSNCQKGLTEFIDIDVSVLKDRMKTKGIYYVAFEVLSWSHIPFDKMEKCFFGVMSRKSMFNDRVSGGDYTHPNFYHMLSENKQKKIDFKGEVFEPSTVQFRFDLNSSETVCMPLLYDIKNNQFIWVDLAVSTKTFNPQGNNINLLKQDNVIPMNSPLCIENLSNGTIAACYASVYMSKPNLYDLFTTNVKARGGELVNRDEAELICSLDGDVTPFYRDIITKDWM